MRAHASHLLDGNSDYRGGGALLGLWAPLLLLSVVLEAAGFFPAGGARNERTETPIAGNARAKRDSADLPDMATVQMRTATMTDDRYPTRQIHSRYKDGRNVARRHLDISKRGNQTHATDRHGAVVLAASGVAPLPRQRPKRRVRSSVRLPREHLLQSTQASHGRSV